MSPKFSLNLNDWKSVGIGALKNFLGTVLLAVAAFLASVDPVTGHFGQSAHNLGILIWVALATNLSTVLVNIVYKFLQGKPASQ